MIELSPAEKDGLILIGSFYENSTLQERVDSAVKNLIECLERGGDLRYPILASIARLTKGDMRCLENHPPTGTCSLPSAA